MKIPPLLIYLWGMCDSMKSSLESLAISSLIAFTCVGVFTAMYLVIESKSIYAAIKNFIIGFGFVSGFCFFLNIFIPSSNTLAVMFIAPAIANSDAIQKDMPELYSVAVKALKSSLEEKVKESAK